MNVVDTNILVRLLTGDDPAQTASARHLFATEPIFIAKTVLLETGWVLASLYSFDDSAICAAFKKLLGLKRVHVEDEASVAIALGLVAQGMDLADAMHLASRPSDARFVSFDRALVGRARRAGATGVAELK